MKFFGPWWDAPITENTRAVLTPVGDKCAGCAAAVELGEPGVIIPHLTAGEEEADQAWHRDCFLEATTGMTKPLPSQQGPGQSGQSE